MNRGHQLHKRMWLTLAMSSAVCLSLTLICATATIAAYLNGEAVAISADTYSSDRGIDLRLTQPSTLTVSRVSGTATSFGFKEGDLVTEIDGDRLEALTPDEIRRALSNRQVMLTIKTGNSETTFSCFTRNSARVLSSASSPAGGVPAIAARLPTGVACGMGNIAPYRNDVLLRLGQNWFPVRITGDPIVLFTIGRDGEVRDAEMFQSSGDRRIDSQTLGAVYATEFAALPAWFKGDQLTFKVELSKLAALQDTSQLPARPPAYYSIPTYTASEVPEMVMKKVRGNWQRSEGPVVQFEVSHDSVNLSIARSSGND